MSKLPFDKIPVNDGESYIGVHNNTVVRFTSVPTQSDFELLEVGAYSKGSICFGIWQMAAGSAFNSNILTELTSSRLVVYVSARGLWSDIITSPTTEDFVANPPADSNKILVSINGQRLSIANTFSQTVEVHIRILIWKND